MNATAADRVPLLRPDDEFNRALVSAVHPPGWVNPRPGGRYNLVVIGAGTAGLVSAAGAAGLVRVIVDVAISRRSSVPDVFPVAFSLSEDVPA